MADQRNRTVPHTGCARFVRSCMNVHSARQATPFRLICGRTVPQRSDAHDVQDLHGSHADAHELHGVQEGAHGLYAAHGELHGVEQGTYAGEQPPTRTGVTGAAYDGVGRTTTAHPVHGLPLVAAGYAYEELAVSTTVTVSLPTESVADANDGPSVTDSSATASAVAGVSSNRSPTPRAAIAASQTRNVLFIASPPIHVFPSILFAPAR